MGLRPHYLMDVLVGGVAVLALIVYFFFAARIL